MSPSENIDALIDQVRQALRTVIDPELGYNIVDLGLIYDVRIEDGNQARIAMTTTTRGCPATQYLVEGAYRSAGTVPGVADVEVDLTYDPPWQPAMASLAAKRHLGIAAGADQ